MALSKFQMKYLLKEKIEIVLDREYTFEVDHFGMLQLDQC